MKLTSRISGKACDQKLGDDAAERGRTQPLARVFLDVLAVQDRGHDRRVGRRAADTLVLEFLDQRRLAEARRRLGEVLLGLEAQQLERLALVHRGQRRRLVVVWATSSWPSVYTRMKPSNLTTWPVARKTAPAASISTVVRS